jgi:hypothetical protein
MEPARFRAYLEADLGKRAADLVTVAPGSQGERTDREETTSHREKKSESGGKTARLLAILRAPELVQDLYRQGRKAQCWGRR